MSSFVSCIWLSFEHIAFIYYDHVLVSNLPNMNVARYSFEVYLWPFSYTSDNFSIMIFHQEKSVHDRKRSCIQFGISTTMNEIGTLALWKVLILSFLFIWKLKAVYIFLIVCKKVLTPYLFSIWFYVSSCRIWIY